MFTRLVLSSLVSGAALLTAPTVFANCNTQSQEVPVVEVAAERPVDLVICLDTSGSMKGLIEAAKQKLWAIVNDLALAEPTPKLRVSLYTYGNNGHASETGWVKMETPLTEDLDTVSMKLFEQTTNGGDEYVARVMQAAMNELDWSNSPDALKLIFVAGNEAATQDPAVNVYEMSKRAIENNVMVNAIYCGSPADNLAPGWREVSMKADGHFASIDHNNGTVVIETPFDEELAALSASLNSTYLPYGEMGEFGCSNQIAQDVNAAGLNNAAVASRAVTKGGKLYRNSNWDLVDAIDVAEFKLEDVKDEDLPEALRGKTLEEKKALIAKTEEERKAIQTDIAELDKRRKAYITVEQQKQALDENHAFDSAVRRAVRSQAASKGFKFAEELPPPPSTENLATEAVEASTTNPALPANSNPTNVRLPMPPALQQRRPAPSQSFQQGAGQTQSAQTLTQQGLSPEAVNALHQSQAEVLQAIAGQNSAACGNPCCQSPASYLQTGLPFEGWEYAQASNLPNVAMPGWTEEHVSSATARPMTSVDSDRVAIRVEGQMDGSFQLHFSRHAATITQEHLNLFSTLKVNGIEWSPVSNLTLSNSNETAFLPVEVDFSTAQLKHIKGRDTVSMETRDGVAIVSVSDTPNGSDYYVFEIWVEPVGDYAEITVSAEIDGSDELHITRSGAQWIHKFWDWPVSSEVHIDDMKWNPKRNTFLANNGATAFLPAGVKLSTARIHHKEGRDLISLEVGEERIILRFADQPIGSSRYQVTLRFGREPQTTATTHVQEEQSEGN